MLISWDMLRARLIDAHDCRIEGEDRLRLSSPAMGVRREARGIRLEVEVGPADRIPADAALTHGAALLAGAPAIVGGQLVVYAWFPLGRRDVADLDRLIDELARDGSILRRRLRPDGARAALANIFAE